MEFYSDLEMFMEFHEEPSYYEKTIISDYRKCPLGQNR